MDVTQGQKSSSECPSVKNDGRMKRSSVSIIGLLRESPKGLSIEEIVSKRHAKEDILPGMLPHLQLRTYKYLNRLRNEGRVFRGRRPNGEEVWSDELIKLEQDPELDYYRLPIKELFKKYGKKK